MYPSDCKPAFKLLGGSLCLDFANTVDWRLSESPVELLNSYRDLVDWTAQAGILTGEQARLLEAESGRDSLAASAVLDRAVAVRETIFRVFSAYARRRVVDPGDLEALNAALPEAMSKARLVATDDGFTWAWSGAGGLDWMLWPITRSAAELLTSPELDQVKMCSDPTCGWLFVDRSKNGRRTWCSMRDCGNRAKARRFFAKNKTCRRP
jgi:predicted RNA-binding Zn ribbon-like protein